MVAASAKSPLGREESALPREDRSADRGTAKSRFTPRGEELAENLAKLSLQRGLAEPFRPFLIEPNWVLMAPIIAAAALVNTIATVTFPNAYAMVGWMVAFVIAALTPWAVRYEQQQSFTVTSRNTLGTFIVITPMFLIGLAVSQWTSATQAQWADAIGTLVIIGVIASIILKRRAASIISAQVALWTGAAIVAGNRGVWFALTVGAAIGLYTAIQQAKADARELQRQRTREHNQLRAEEILSDFEQTGHGWFWETDRRGLLVYISPTISDVLDVPHARLLGRPLSDLFDLAEQGSRGERSLAFYLTARSPFLDLVLKSATSSEERWWSVSGRPLYDSYGSYLGFRGSGNDLTEKLRSEEQASRLAHFDALTGLANRVQMAMALEKILNAPAADGRTCAVFCWILIASSRSTTPLVIRLATFC